MWDINPTSTIGSFMKIGLLLLGIWPGAQYRIFARTFWTTMFVMIEIFHCQYIIAYYKYDTLMNMMDVASLTLSCGMALMKLIVFWINERLLRGLLAIMNKESQMPETQYSNNLMARTIHLSHYLTNRILGLYPVVSIFYSLGVLACVNQAEEQGLVPRKLIWTMKLPFQYDTSPVYETTLIVQFFVLATCSVSYGILSCLLLTLILHVGCQIDILCQEITEISPKKDKRFGSLIQRHQEIIAFIENVEQLFTYIALMQLISNTLTICCIGFLMVISIGTENASAMIMKSTLFYIVVASDAFMFCFAGEYLSTKTGLIASAAYESLWFNLQPADCRILLLIILRSQKELTITTGKVSNLSLNSFASILKASMSYISVLLAMS